MNDKVRIIRGDPFSSYVIDEAVGNLDQVTLLAPCLPTKVIGLAANYRGATGVTENMKEPLFFIKPASSIGGPFDDIICPFKDRRVWGEAELGIVIGRRTKNASIDEAAQSVFGYLCANDVTAENIDERDHHLARAKAADTFCPIGPWIDTQFNLTDKTIKCWQNKKLIREAKLDDMIWQINKIIHFLSQWMTLEIGDVIITGTPPRVVEKTYLQNGDIFEVEIEGLGGLKNQFFYR